MPVIKKKPEIPEQTSCNKTLGWTASLVTRYFFLLQSTKAVLPSSSKGSFCNKPQRRRSCLTSLLVAHNLNLILVTNPACFLFHFCCCRKSSSPEGQLSSYFWRTSWKPLVSLLQLTVDSSVLTQILGFFCEVGDERFMWWPLLSFRYSAYYTVLATQPLPSLIYQPLIHLVQHNSWQVLNYYMFRYRDAIFRQFLEHGNTGVPPHPR
jgi:hypothetical protein